MFGGVVDAHDDCISLDVKFVLQFSQLSSCNVAALLQSRVYE